MSEKTPDDRLLPPLGGGSAHRSHGWEDAGDLTLAPLNLRDALAVVRRHLWLVLVLTLAGGGVAAYVAYSAQPTYRATAVIRLADARRALSGNLVEGPVSALAGRTIDPLLSQLEVLQSRAIAAAVVDSLPMLRLRTSGFPAVLVRDVWIASPARGDSLRLEFGADHVTALRPGETARAAYGAPLEFADMGFTVRRRPVSEWGQVVVLSRARAAAALVASLTLRPRAGTDVVDVSYVTRDPWRAQLVVNRVVDVFKESNAVDAQQQSRRRREFIDAQLRFNDSLLAEARQALSVFQARAYRSLGQLPAEWGGLSGLEVRREELVAEREMYRRLVARLEQPSWAGERQALRTVASLPGVASHVEVAQLYRQLVSYEASRDSLRTAAPAHPELPRLDALIASTEAGVIQAALAAVQSLTASLDARIATLDDLRSRNAMLFQRRSASEAEEARLGEQLETVQRLGDQLREEYQRARIAEAIELGQVEIVDYADVPAVMTGIGLRRLVSFGLLLGLLTGTGGAFLIEHLSTSIRRREQVAELGLPLLGVVPHLRGRPNGRRAALAGPVVEALRGIRLNLVHAYGAAGPLLVAVTSPGSRDGKSFIGANLALAFAHAGHRTLLMDGDVRHGALHRLLDGERKPGLTDYLMGEVASERIVQETAFGSLDFIGCGTRTADAPELLGSAVMTQLVTGLRSSYGVIVVDTPPLNAGVDAFALATATGNLLMVLRLGMTDRTLLKVKLELLRRLPIRVLGAVLNDVRGGELYRQYSYYLEGYDAKPERAGRPRRLLQAPR